MKTAAVIGCGRAIEGKVGWAIGHSHAGGYQRALPELRLIGVDPNPENLAAFGRQFGIPSCDLFASTDAMYDAVIPDIVSICTWPVHHAPMTIEAAARGVRGIICEKPAALSGRDLRAMQDAVDLSGSVLAVAHQRRYEPLYTLVRDLLPRIGSPRVLEARVSDGWDILSWSVHWFDMAAFMFEAPIASVLAGIDEQGTTRYAHAVEDSSVVFAEWTSGDQAVFITGPSHAAGPSLTLRGPDGFILVQAGHAEVFTRDGYERVSPPTEAWDDTFAQLIHDVAVAVDGGPRDFACAAPTALQATEVAMAVYASAVGCTKVRLPLEAKYNALELHRRPRVESWGLGPVLLLADEHFGSGGREGIVQALSAHGANVRLADATQPLDAAAVEDVGVLALYHTQTTPDDVTKATLSRWVAQGRPLVLIHAALGAYPDWAEYGQWCGRVWEWGVSDHPYEPTSLGRLAAGKDVWDWDTAWIPTDEVFIKLGDRAPVEDLLTAQIPQGSFPAAWFNVTYPNIATWVPGHRRDIWEIEMMGAALGGLMRAVVARSSVNAVCVSRA